MEDVVIEKNLHCMTSKLNYVVCSIDKSYDSDTLSINELQSSLLVYEQCMNDHLIEEQSLKVFYEDQSGGRRIRSWRILRMWKR